MIKFKERLTRTQFESLFNGKWEEEKNGRVRRNKKFRTFSEKGKKTLHTGKAAVSGKTWTEIAKALELI